LFPGELPQIAAPGRRRPINRFGSRQYGSAIDRPQARKSSPDPPCPAPVAGTAAPARVNQILVDSIKYRRKPSAAVDDSRVRFAVARHLYGNLPFFSADLYHLFIGLGRDFGQ
jgi:hypothetical protein